MQNINFTPIDIEKLKGKKSSNINFYLLITVTIVAAIFSVLLFIYIQQKNEKLNQLNNTEEITQTEPTQIPTLAPSRIPTIMQKIASGTPRIGTPTPSIKTTTPAAGLKTSTNGAKISSTSAF